MGGVGYSELETYSNTTVFALLYLLGLVEKLGVGRCGGMGDALIAQVRDGLKGLECTPLVGAREPVVTFRVGDAAGAQKKLAAAKVDVLWTSERMRVSPSAYNDAGDVAALGWSVVRPVADEP